MTGSIISTGLSSFMASSNIGTVPVRIWKTGIVWGGAESAQDPIVPLLKMNDDGIRSMLQSGSNGSISSSLFRNCQRLRPAIGEAAIEDLRERARTNAKTGSHDAAAMMRELAFHMCGESGEADTSDRIARTEIAQAWLTSLKEYSEPASDRLRIARGICYGWGGGDVSVYRALLLMSMETYRNQNQKLKAGEDQLRIALALSREEPLDADAYEILGDMIQSAAVMLDDTWQQEFNTTALRYLAAEAKKLAERG